MPVPGEDGFLEDGVCDSLDSWTETSAWDRIDGIRKIHRRLKDKGKMANKTVGRAWNRQSITTWAHHVAGEIKSTEPLDMRGN